MLRAGLKRLAEAAMDYLAGKPVVCFKYGDPGTKIAGADNPLMKLVGTNGSLAARENYATGARHTRLISRVIYVVIN